jgi:hypothetical protein
VRSNDLMVGDHVPIHEDRLPWVMSVAMNMVPRFKRENSSVYYCTVNSRLNPYNNCNYLQM